MTDVPLDVAVGKESSEYVIAIDEPVLANDKLTIKCVRIEFTDGTEIRKRDTNLSSAIELLRKLVPCDLTMQSDEKQLSLWES